MYQFKIKTLPKSEVEIEASIPKEELDSAHSKAIKKFSETIQIDGFRKGNVPEKIVLEKLGARAILEEASEILLSEHYPKILAEAKLDTIGRPEISITKLALGNPVEFKVKTAVMPEFKLPEYKKIATEIKAKQKNKDEKIEADEKEVNDVLLQIRKNKAHLDWSHSAEATRDEQGNLMHNHPDFEKEENLPALDDELAKEAGNFANLEELKAKIKENIVTDKKNREIEKRRAEMIDELIKATPIEVPAILIENETEKSLAQFKDDIQRMGGKWEDYLAHAKKTEAEIKKDMWSNSEKRAKIQLIFNKIAETEKLEPNKEILEHEVKQILSYHKDANEMSVRIYVTTMLLNQEVLKLLENN